MTYKSDDVSLLLPSMASAVRALFVALEKAGLRPVLHDGLRTPEEAYRNASNGAGVTDSMHCYGAAADIICGMHGWSCDDVGCDFYKHLVAEAEKLGFVCGVHFRRVDTCHIQGLPVSAQPRMRALGRDPDSIGARDAIVAAFLKRRR